MIDEAEQIVYRVIHNGWLSKEHQAVSCPPYTTRERRGGQWESGRASPPPLACRYLKPVINDTIFFKYTQDIDSKFTSIHQKPCWALYETTACKVLVFSLKGMLCIDMCYWFGGTSRETLVWLQTCNNGYPHSTTTVCHWARGITGHPRNGQQG